MSVLFLPGLVLMLSGPFLHGLSGSDDPRAYVFAPILLAGLLPLLARRGLSPHLRQVAQGLLICGGLCLGAWALGGMLTPRPLAAAAPLGSAIAGALVCAAAGRSRVRQT